MDLFIYIIFLLSLFVLWKLLQSFYFGQSANNPFENDSRVSLRPHVTDQKLRDSVLKQSFKLDKVPTELDAIVIGSGIGGLATAAILAKSGKKVLVLEQHDQAGGCCHTYIEKGYEFDVGIHYIGDMHRQSIGKTLIDQISEGQIQWNPLDDEYDTVVFNEKNGNPPRFYPIVAGLKNQKQNLLKHFPEEKEAIEKYFEIILKGHESYASAMVLKFLPLWLVKILNRLSLIDKITKFFKFNKMNVKETLNGLTSNQTLRDIFCYCYGDYGTVPSKSGIPIQALLTRHFLDGGSYPIGGASEIAHSIIPVIERAGGKVFVRAEVTEILFDSDKVVEGVKVKHGKNKVQVFCPVVISDAGAYNTFLKFIPQDIAKDSRLFPLMSKKRAVAAISVFVGLDATPEELEIPTKKNWWVFNRNDIDKACVDYVKLSKEEIEDTDVPLMFVSFPSTKDPTWEKRYPGKTTLAIVTLSNYDWFKEWENAPCQKRGDEYEGVKKTIGWRMLDQVTDLFPKIKNHVDYVSVGSPLSNTFYLGAAKGEIYGFDHDQERFSAINFALLRPTTDLQGLYLTGQDVCTCGFVGALWGGLICSQQVLGRNVFGDLKNLHKKLKGDNKKEH